MPGIEKERLKREGLAFGRSLQSTFKTVVMYSVDHPSAAKALQQTYAQLNSLVKQTQQFAFGFMNGRVLVNDILTDDKSLSQLETEFQKREVGAISFLVGISQGQFKQAMVLLATKPKVIEASGGAKRFFHENPLTGAHIFPATKPGRGDAVLPLPHESYLTAQSILGPPGGAVGGFLDPVLQSAGWDKIPTEPGNVEDVLAQARKTTESLLTNPEGDFRELLVALSRLLEALTVENLLSPLPAVKQSELSGQPSPEMASALLEDMVVEWAAGRLVSSSVEGAPAVLEEEVIRALARALRATLLAKRLLDKLAHVLEEAHLPPQVYERIREGVMWYGLSQQEKHQRLMQQTRFGPREFSRLLNHVQELVRETKSEETTQVAEHYFALLDRPRDESQLEALRQAPDLLRAISGAGTLEFLHGLAARLSKELLNDEPPDRDVHREVVKCLATIAEVQAVYENFQAVQCIGLEFERSLCKNPTQHSDCCGEALKSLLKPGAVEQLIELFVEKRDEFAWGKTAVFLLKCVGLPAAEAAFERLDREQVVANRMQLLRLVVSLGAAGAEGARKKLTDQRWYMVRNACYVLGELRDTDLATRLENALRHPDGRVQRAAVTALNKNQAPGRGRSLADALLFFHADLLEFVLDELSFLKDSASVEGLAQFVLGGRTERPLLVEKAIRALAAIGSDAAIRAIREVLTDVHQPLSARKTALVTLAGSSAPGAQQILRDFTRQFPNDPLVVESQK